MSESNSANLELLLSLKQQRQLNKSLSQLKAKSSSKTRKRSIQDNPQLRQSRGLPVDSIETDDDALPEVEVPEIPQNTEGDTFRFGTEPQDSGIPETTRSRVASRRLIICCILIYLEQ